MSPLLLAAETNNARIVELCIQKKANLNIVSRNGATALILAAKRGNIDVLNVFTLEDARSEINFDAQDVRACTCAVGVTV